MIGTHLTQKAPWCTPVFRRNSTRWERIHISWGWIHEVKPHEAPISKNNSKQYRILDAELPCTWAFMMLRSQNDRKLLVRVRIREAEHSIVVIFRCAEIVDLYWFPMQSVILFATSDVFDTDFTWQVCSCNENPQAGVKPQMCEVPIWPPGNLRIP